MGRGGGVFRTRGKENLTNDAPPKKNVLSLLLANLVGFHFTCGVFARCPLRKLNMSQMKPDLGVSKSYSRSLWRARLCSTCYYSMHVSSTTCVET